MAFVEVGLCQAVTHRQLDITVDAISLGLGRREDMTFLVGQVLVDSCRYGVCSQGAQPNEESERVSCGDGFQSVPSSAGIEDGVGLPQV